MKNMLLFFCLLANLPMPKAQGDDRGYIVKTGDKAPDITYPLTPDPDGKSFYSFAAKGAGVTRNIIIDKKGKIAFMTRLYDTEEFQEMSQIIDELLR